MDTDITVVQGWREINELKEELATSAIAALDTETTTSAWYEPEHRLLCIAISTREGHAYVIPWDHAQNLQRLGSLNEVFGPADSQPIWVMQNGAFDYLVMRNAGVDLRAPWEDTMGMQYLLDVEAPKGLTALVERWLDLPPWKDIDYKHPEEEDLSTLMRLCGRDADATLRVYNRISHEIYSDDKLTTIYQNLLKPAMVALAEMEEYGVPIDLNYLQDLTERKQEEIDLLVERLRGWAGDDKYNPNSTQQTAKLLFGKLGLPVTEFTATGAPSTSASVLDKLRRKHPIIEDLLRYRSLRKLTTASLVPWSDLASYDRGLAAGIGWLHPRYKPAFVKTGRLSSESPNIQQVPRDSEVRRVFTAPAGYNIAEFDYSQLELRIVAWLANEATMLDAYKRGVDLHVLTAERLGVDRQTGKTANFGLLYGAGYRKLRQIAADEYGLDLSEAEAQAIHSGWFTAYPRIAGYHYRCIVSGRRDEGVRTPFGRWRPLPDIRSSDQAVRSHNERQAINTPVQSTASDLTLLMITEFVKDGQLREWGVRPIITVHDSILFLIPEDAGPEVVSYLRDRMENPPTKQAFGVEIGVPLVVDHKIGKNWGDAS